MARPQRSRRVCDMPSVKRFVPSLLPVSPDETPGEPIVLTVDEYEALRLVDREGRHTASVPFK